MEKKEKIEELTADEYAMIHVRADMEKVDIPKHLKKERSLALKISHYFANPLFINDKTLEIELLFNGVPHKCVIPYESIWATTSASGEHFFWDKDLPKDLEILMEDVKKLSEKNKPLQSVKPVKLKTATLKEDASDSESEDSGKESKKTKKASGHLKLVK